MKAIVLLLALASCRCVYNPAPGPSPSTTSTTGAATCTTACARLSELGCEASKPTAKGATCAEVCENAERNGLVRWGVDCVVSAASCEVADECGGAI